MENTFWLNDIKVLYEDNNYMRFIPTMNMTRIEQLNSIARFCFYWIILIIIINRESNYLALPVLILIFTIALYLLDKNSKNDKFSDIIDNPVPKKINTLHQKNIESGYYDSDGKLRIGKFNGITHQDMIDKKAKDFVNYDFNELLEYQKKALGELPLILNFIGIFYENK
jgi:hypothetical protein